MGGQLDRGDRLQCHLPFQALGITMSGIDPVLFPHKNPGASTPMARRGAKLPNHTSAPSAQVGMNNWGLAVWDGDFGPKDFVIGFEPLLDKYGERLAAYRPITQGTEGTGKRRILGLQHERGQVGVAVAVEKEGGRSLAGLGPERWGPVGFQWVNGLPLGRAVSFRPSCWVLCSVTETNVLSFHAMFSHQHSCVGA